MFLIYFKTFLSLDTLSFIGWSAMFANRLVVFALAFTQFPFWLISFFILHVFGFTAWIYSIAKDEWRKVKVSNQTRSTPRPLPLAILVFLFFGLPSLLLWPMMFQLNKRCRPIIFLFITLAENVILLLSWHYYKTESFLFTSTQAHRHLLTDDENFCLWLVICCTLGAFLFLILYIFCKPENTEQVALHDISHNYNEKSYDYGLYYEFCQHVFPLEVDKKFAVELKKLRRGFEN